MLTVRIAVALVAAAAALASPAGGAPGAPPSGVGADRAETPPSNFIGEGTNDLATAVMQGFDGEERDAVFSPLGYSAVLALLAEGAGGETRNQLVAALRLAEDTYAVRQNYKAVLGAMQERWSINKPEFKNWFYVYKNYTVNENYRKILSENYFTEVKSVDRVHYELNFDKEEDKIDEVKETFDEEKETEPVDPSIKSEASKDVNEGKEDEQKKVSEEQLKKSEISNKVNENKKDEQENAEVDRPDGKSTFDASKDIATALTANRIVVQNSKGAALDAETKMIIFNGFYFRGNWKTPFALTKEDAKRSFYKSPSVKTQVTMMQTSGVFDLGNVPELDALAIELPYEDTQYSMLILLPNQRDGLSKLTADITNFSLNKVYKYLVERTVEVLIPKCKIQTISNPEEILKKNGVTNVFSDDADLSGISSDKLKMGALVQLVNFQIDEGSSDVNFLTTSSTSAASRNNVEKFVADHPFLFFIRDQPKNIIVAAGKVVDPQFKGSSDFSS